MTTQTPLNKTEDLLEKATIKIENLKIEKQKEIKNILLNFVYDYNKIWIWREQ